LLFFYRSLQSIARAAAIRIILRSAERVIYQGHPVRLLLCGKKKKRRSNGKIAGKTSSPLSLIAIVLKRD
jgi:hypothetical protein